MSYIIDARSSIDDYVTLSVTLEIEWSPRLAGHF